MTSSAHIYTEKNMTADVGENQESNYTFSIVYNISGKSFDQVKDISRVKSGVKIKVTMFSMQTQVMNKEK